MGKDARSTVGAGDAGFGSPVTGSTAAPVGEFSLALGSRMKLTPIFSGSRFLASSARLRATSRSGTPSKPMLLRRI